jgi:hypothetical protein
MIELVMEGVLVAAVLVAAGTLIGFVIVQFTPLGRRWREARDRRELASGTALNDGQSDPFAVNDDDRTPTEH